MFKLSASLEVWYGLYILCIICAFGSSDVSLGKGHMEPLGSHQDPEPSIEEVDDFDISPQEFHEQYVKGGKPLMFRGGAKMFPAFHKWTDAHLKQNYGSFDIAAEPEKKETRNASVQSMPFSDFLDSYKSQNIFMINDAMGKMKDDLVIPKPIVCGGYASLVQAAVLWFSSGGTKSVLHNDDTDNVNCLMDGTKDIVVLDKRQKDKVQRNSWQYLGTYSHIDVEKVDMAANPEMRDVPWYRVVMNKGDCLFIPRRWYHQVNSSPPRNLAVNLWLGHLKQFDQTDCDKKGAEVPLFEPLSDWHLVGMGDTYGGGAANKPPLDEPKIKEDEVWRAMFQEFNGFVDVNIRDFMGVYKETPGRKEEIQKFFEAVDSNGDGVVSQEELEAAPADDLLKRFPWVVQQEDPAGESSGESQRDEL